jgi:hypothetical protein
LRSGDAGVTFGRKHKITQICDLLAPLNNVLGLFGTALTGFDNADAERGRDAPSTLGFLTRIETGDDSQARNDLGSLPVSQ